MTYQDLKEKKPNKMKTCLWGKSYNHTNIKKPVH